MPEILQQHNVEIVEDMKLKYEGIPDLLAQHSALGEQDFKKYAWRYRLYPC